MADQLSMIASSETRTRDGNSIRHTGSRHVSTFRPLDFDKNEVGADNLAASLATSLRIAASLPDPSAPAPEPHNVQSDLLMCIAAVDVEGTGTELYHLTIFRSTKTKAAAATWR